MFLMSIKLGYYSDVKFKRSSCAAIYNVTKIRQPHCTQLVLQAIINIQSRRRIEFGLLDEMLVISFHLVRAWHILLFFWANLFSKLEKWWVWYVPKSSAFKVR